MKILIVEDSVLKREQLEEFLKSKGIEFDVFEYIIPALRYIRSNAENINGIILDLGLKSMENWDDYDLRKGIFIAHELRRKKINIPILINSETIIPESFFTENVFEHRTKMDDYDSLERFITFLQEKKEQ